MSNGNYYPLTCCDRDCAGANGCRVGGYQCDFCGMWFCGHEMEECGGHYLCEVCAEEWRHENEDDEEDEEGSICPAAGELQTVESGNRMDDDSCAVKPSDEVDAI